MGLQLKCFLDLNPPHIHAVYGEYNGLFDIQKLDIIEGDLPKRAVDLVMEWTSNHQQELINIWETKKFNKLPGLK